MVYITFIYKNSDCGNWASPLTLIMWEQRIKTPILCDHQPDYQG
jgi:hypothetical protein